MRTIFLYGDRRDAVLRTALLGALAQCGSVLYVEEGVFFQAPEEAPAFFVYECECLPSFSVSKGLLLMKNSCSGRELSLPSGIWAVLESGNHSGACALRHQSAPVISCGCSARDTLSLASIEEDTAVLSLQRSVLTLGGNLVEPHDFAVMLQSKRHPHQILPIAMTLLLCGVSTERGYSI